MHLKYQSKEIELKIDKRKRRGKQQQPPPSLPQLRHSHSPPSSHQRTPNKFESSRKSTNQQRFSFLLVLVELLVLSVASAAASQSASLLLTTATETEAASSPSSAAACHSDYSHVSLEYDRALYDELHMHDTLVNLYRSCYKDKFDERLKYQLFKSSGLASSQACDNAKSSNSNRKLPVSSALNSTTPKTTTTTSTKYSRTSSLASQYVPPAREILIELLLDKKHSIIPIDVMNRIDLICDVGDNENANTKDNPISLLDRLFLLSDYQSICGNAFKNSIRQSHLMDYVLRLSKTAEQQQKQQQSSTFTPPLLVPPQAHFYLNSRNHLHHNPHYHILGSGSSSSSSREDEFITLKRNVRPAANSARNSTKNRVSAGDGGEVRVRIVLSNCKLVLLNVFLLSFKTSCDFEDFVEILKHYDCTNNFSVNSNCEKCRVNTPKA